MMKINGTTVYPETVFSCLESLPGITDYYIVARSNDGYLSQAEVTVSISRDSLLTLEAISNKIAATARVRLGVSIKSYEQVHEKIFLGISRKPVRFFIVESKEGLL